MSLVTSGFSQVGPRYSDRSLSDLLPSVAARAGLPGGTDLLDLPAADRWVVLLIDGLGHALLHKHAAVAPYLSSMVADREALTAGVPSTTATSIASLGTGLPPGRHGVTGYTSRIPGTLRLLNALTWHDDVDPDLWQPHRTVFERLADAGIEATVVSRGSFRGSGLTRVSQRGAHYVDSDTPWDRADDVSATVTSAARQNRPSVTYTYESQLDHIGHEHGCTSDRWLDTLASVDADALLLRRGLPPGTVLVITGDHGMIDVPDGDRIDADGNPDLRDGVVLLGGEARFRQLWTRPGATDDVAACWRATCGERAWVVTRDQAEARGWFGHVDDTVRPRIGDVLVAARGTTAVVASHQFAVEMRMRGFHGSLTPAEMDVPLLIDVI